MGLVKRLRSLKNFLLDVLPVIALVGHWVAIYALAWSAFGWKIGTLILLVLVAIIGYIGFIVEKGH